MRMFVYCFDKDLEVQLIAKGYKVIKKDKAFSVLIANNAKFDFSNIDKEKYMFSNKLTFSQ